MKTLIEVEPISRSQMILFLKECEREQPDEMVEVMATSDGLKFTCGNRRFNLMSQVQRVRV